MRNIIAELRNGARPTTWWHRERTEELVEFWVMLFVSHGFPVLAEALLLQLLWVNLLP
jgi:hypothetical protein